MSKTYDAILIGAGIMGCSTAFELAGRGMSVAVLEKGRLGAGPTGESSAIIRQHYSNELTARMAHYSLRIFQDFEDRIGEDCGFKETGFIALVPATNRAGLEANLAVQQRIGIDTRLISTDDLRELIPGLNTADAVAAAYEPESGYSDAYLTVTAYANAAKRLGADIYQSTRVTEILFEGDRVKGVCTVDGEMHAPIVVNCAGAWAAQVGVMAGLVDDVMGDVSGPVSDTTALPIRSCRVQVAILRRPADMSRLHPVVVDFIHASYFRADAGNITIAGLIDPAEADAVVDPDDYDKHTDFDFATDIAERLIKRWPDLERGELAEGYASLYAVTPDWHPIIDEVPEGSGHFICSGFSGHGFKLGPAVGLMTADLITGKPDPMFDATTFRLSRFAENAPVRGSYEYSILG